MSDLETWLAQAGPHIVANFLWELSAEAHKAVIDAAKLRARRAYKRSPVVENNFEVYPERFIRTVYRDRDDTIYRHMVRFADFLRESGSWSESELRKFELQLVTSARQYSSTGRLPALKYRPTMALLAALAVDNT